MNKELKNIEEIDLFYDLVIIGGGSAGLASAISAYKNGTKSIVIIEKDKYLGGILNQCIHNGFGLHTFKEELTGPEYASRYVKIVEEYNIECKLNTMVLKITSDLKVHISNSEGYKVIQTKAIICSTGCSERTRGNIATPGSRPQGVLTAGLAQRYLNIDGYLVGKKVFILGSGDIGLIMARRMVLEGAKVLGVAEIMPYSNGLNRNIVQCLEDYNIPLYLHHTVRKIIGKDKIEKIIVSPVDDNLNFIEGKDLEFEVDTLLLSVGLIPSNPLLEAIGVKIHPKTKGPIVDANYQTSIPGIFACGNSLHVHDLVDFVSNEGDKAGQKASEYIKNHFAFCDDIEVENGQSINYVLPQYLNISDEEVELKFRVKEPISSCNIVIKNNEKTLKKIKKQYMLPAEMTTIKINTSGLTMGKLTIEVERI